MTTAAGALGAALDRLWDELGDRSSLFPSLPADAAMARARAGEAVEATPRLLELAIGSSTQMSPTEPFELLRASSWDQWPTGQRRAVEQFADTWWESIRGANDPEPAPGLVLACLSRLGLPMVRWLGPWLDDLDGPAAGHLADVVISQLPEPEWRGYDDERSQVLAWCRTEPVVIGLTVVGGVHLADGQLGAALDLML